MKLSLYRLSQIKNKLEQENFTDSPIYDRLCEEILNRENIFEDGTSATGGLQVGGMGAVVNAQPSSLAGSTIGTAWSSAGGSEGSGDISIPYNPSGSNRMFQKIPSDIGRNHGPRTGKRSRKKRLDIKSIKNMMSKKDDYTKGEGGVKKHNRVMSFDNFIKDDFKRIKK